MARVRKNVFLCGMRSQTSCNARVQIGSSRWRAYCEIVRVSVGFCAVRAHERFVQCASAMSSCPCSVLVWDQCGSWAGACENEVVGFMLECRSVYRGAPVRESVPQYGVRPPRSLYHVLPCSCGNVCRLAHVHGSVHLYGARPKRLCAVRTHKGFMPCAGARPPGFSTKCLCARVGTCANEQACTSVVRAYKGVVLLCACVRCEPIQGLYTVRWCSPTRALYQVLTCSCGRVCR